MRNRFGISVALWITVMALSPILQAQQAAVPAAGATAQSQGESSKIPDLSGPWTRGQGGFGSSLSLSDPRQAKRGYEDDIPYQPWAREKTLSQRTSTGPEAQYYNSTNPQMWCDPVGSPAVYGWPAKTEFVQTPKAVYILHEYGISFRIVWLNSTHPEDPDPQYWGDSIGWYENGDTLVVDSVGFNDRTWLDQVGHPHTELLHFIERYEKVGDTIELEMTVDDPGAYAKPWPGRKTFRKSTTGFFRFQWPCSVRDNQEHYEKVGQPGNPGATTFK